MNNTPDDWDSHSRKCDACGMAIHDSEGPCECQDMDEVGNTCDDGPYRDELDDLLADREAERHFDYIKKQRGKKYD